MINGLLDHLKLFYGLCGGLILEESCVEGDLNCDFLVVWVDWLRQNKRPQIRLEPWTLSHILLNKWCC